MAKEFMKSGDLLLRLYVAGNAPNSEIAIANLKAICEAHFADCHSMDIVDLLQHPRQGLADRIIVTPTLVKLSPLPVRRVIGNLSDTAQVLRILANK